MHLLASRQIGAGIAGRTPLHRRLRRAWDDWGATCADIDRSRHRVGARYEEWCRRGPRRALAVASAPAVGLALLVLVVAATTARILGMAVAGVALLLHATLVAAPIVAAAWALGSVVAGSAASAPAAVATPCDPSYPGLCISLSADDLDCAGRGDAPFVQRTNFRVVGFDVHQLDRDRDGVGCEQPSNGRP